MSPRRFSLILSCLLICSIASVPARAADIFEEVGTFGGVFRTFPPDAHSESMGLAFTALAGGSTAAWWNQGALGLERSVSASYSTADYLGDFDETHAGFTVGGSGVGLGMTWGSLESGDIERTTVFRPDGDGTFFRASYEVLVLGVGVDATRTLGLQDGPFVLGIGTALMRLDSRLDELSAQVDTWEAGALLDWRLVPKASEGSGGPGLNLRLGLALENLGGDPEVARWDRTGVALRAGGGHLEGWGRLLEVGLALERRGLFLQPGDDVEGQDRVGAGVTLLGAFGLRVGRSWLGPWGNPVERDHWGAGIGLEPGNPLLPRWGIRVDYAETDFHDLGATDKVSASARYVF